MIRIQAIGTLLIFVVGLFVRVNFAWKFFEEINLEPFFHVTIFIIKEPVLRDHEYMRNPSRKTTDLLDDIPSEKSDKSVLVSWIIRRSLFSLSNSEPPSSVELNRKQDISLTSEKVTWRPKDYLDKKTMTILLTDIRQISFSTEAETPESDDWYHNHWGDWLFYIKFHGKITLLKTDVVIIAVTTEPVGDFIGLYKRNGLFGPPYFVILLGYNYQENGFSTVQDMKVPCWPCLILSTWLEEKKYFEDAVQENITKRLTLMFAFPGDHDILHMPTNEVDGKEDDFICKYPWDLLYKKFNPTWSPLCSDIRKLPIILLASLLNLTVVSGTFKNSHFGSMFPYIRISNGLIPTDVFLRINSEVHQVYFSDNARIIISYNSSCFLRSPTNVIVSLSSHIDNFIWIGVLISVLALLASNLHQGRMSGYARLKYIWTWMMLQSASKRTAIKITSLILLFAIKLFYIVSLSSKLSVHSESDLDAMKTVSAALKHGFKFNMYANNSDDLNYARYELVKEGIWVYRNEEDLHNATFQPPMDMEAFDQVKILEVGKKFSVQTVEKTPRRNRPIKTDKRKIRYDIQKFYGFEAEIYLVYTNLKEFVSRYLGRILHDSGIRIFWISQERHRESYFRNNEMHAQATTYEFAEVRRLLLALIETVVIGGLIAAFICVIEVVPQLWDT